MVTIYTTEGCPWCKRTKEFLKQHNIKHKEMDVSKNEKVAKEMVRKSGHISVPVVDINEKLLLVLMNKN